MKIRLSISSSDSAVSAVIRPFSTAMP